MEDEVYAAGMISTYTFCMKMKFKLKCNSFVSLPLLFNDHEYRGLEYK